MSFSGSFTECVCFCCHSLFRAFKDFRVRVSFTDRTIVDLDQTGLFARILTTGGDIVHGKLTSNSSHVGIYRHVDGANVDVVAKQTDDQLAVSACSRTF